MWRKTDDRKVWYEWLLDVYVSLPAAAPEPWTSSRSVTQKRGAEDVEKGKARAAPPTATEALQAGQATTGATRRGRKIRIGGSDLHSSEKEACLM
jgi:type II protein arginine methyltransferase